MDSGLYWQINTHAEKTYGTKPEDKLTTGTKKIFHLSPKVVMKHETLKSILSDLFARSNTSHNCLQARDIRIVEVRGSTPLCSTPESVEIPTFQRVLFCLKIP